MSTHQETGSPHTVEIPDNGSIVGDDVRSIAGDHVFQVPVDTQTTIQTNIFPQEPLAVAPPPVGAGQDTFDVRSTGEYTSVDDCLGQAKSTFDSPNYKRLRTREGLGVSTDSYLGLSNLLHFVKESGMFDPTVMTGIPQLVFSKGIAMFTIVVNFLAILKTTGRLSKYFPNRKETIRSPVLYSGHESGTHC